MPHMYTSENVYPYKSAYAALQEKISGNEGGKTKLSSKQSRLQL